MKRGKPLRRTASLRARTPMKRGIAKLKVVRKFDSSEEPCKAVVKRRSGGTCEICGIRPGESVHHRRKQSQQGPWTPSNCLHLCGDGRSPDGCHGMVTNTRSEYYDNGWLVRSWEDWAAKPVLYRGRMVVLDDEGGWFPVVDSRDAA